MSLKTRAKEQLWKQGQLHEMVEENTLYLGDPLLWTKTRINWYLRFKSEINVVNFGRYVHVVAEDVRVECKLSHKTSFIHRRMSESPNQSTFAFQGSSAYST